jgi:gluconate 5-dehydrogenase
VAIDHMDEGSINAGFGEAVRQGGWVDILVANAHEPLASDWRSVTAEQFNRQLMNATGYFLLARLLRDHVVARGGSGSVVLLGSMYGLVGSYPDAYAGLTNASPVAYQALKGGIVQMARHLGVYWAKDGVRVNCLSPGPFPSEAAPAELVERLRAKCPMGRMGRPEELKAAVVFLAGDGSSFMTGQNLVIDGGWTAW